MEEFAEQVWGHRIALSRHGPGAYDDLLTLDAVDDLVSRHGLRTPFLRVARSGSTVPTARYTRGGGVGAGIGDQVDDAALARLFADGCTLVLQGLHRLHAPLMDFAQQLGADLGHPVQVNAYVTPAQNQGFSDHYDVHDVFVLQVAGQKRWRIHDPVHRHPLRDQPWTDRRAAVEAAAGTHPSLDVVLGPGDALYLPAGYLHAAQALGQVSAHLTVGVHSWNRMHLVQQALSLLGDDEQLRTPLPLGVDVTDPSSLLAELQHALDAARSGLARCDPDQIALGMRRLAEESMRAEPVAPIAQSRLGDSLDERTPLRWRAHLPARLTGSDAEVTVTTAEGEIRMPGEALPGLRRLLDGETLSAEEIGMATSRILVRSAVVVAAP